MKDYQKRVTKEADDLSGSLVRLQDFFDTDIYAGLDVDEKVRLHVQECHMSNYLGVLEERIANFDKGDD